jgi:hypothetical protein
MKNRMRSVLFTTAALLLSLHETTSAQRVIRGPYLQIGTPTSIIVRWRTDQATDSRVRYGRSPGSLASIADDAALTTEHEVKLTGLLPDTKYYYAIGTSTATLAGDDTSHFFITSPVPGTSKPTRIWILGDSGTKNNDARTVRNAYYYFTGNRHTDLWLMLGDNAYDDGEDSEYQLAVFQNMYEAMLRKSVLWPTRGNHDRGPDGEGGAYYDIFSLPTAGEAGGLASGTEAYYSFDYGNIHFICLESERDELRAPNSAMWTWLEADLAANDKSWTIAFWHHPPYSKGSHNSDSESELIEMRQRALPILEEGGVDLVLCGHSHSYERSFLLDGHYGKSGTLTSSMKIDDGNGRIDDDGPYTKAAMNPTPHAGAVYVVAGSSGKLSGGSLNHPVMITSLKLLGSLVLDIDGNRLDATFIDKYGRPRDYFTMLKESGGVGPATQLVMISGNNQTAPAGSTLAHPFVVEARDANDNPVPGVAVTFAVSSGGGSLSNSQPQITGQDGRAATTLTLGTTPGTNTVTATAASLSGSPIVFAATAILPPPAIASLLPTDDSYVRNGDFANLNYDAEPRLRVKEAQGDNDDHRVYLKFDLTEVAGSVVSASLKLYCQALPDGSPAKAFVFSVADDEWSEAAITWNNAPPVETLLDSLTTIGNAGEFYTFDVTKFVSSELSGDKRVSLLIKDNHHANKTVDFARREDENPPTLIVETELSTGAQPETGVVIEALPQTIQLYQNYPNPFQQATGVGYRLLQSSHVRLVIYDTNGREVSTLVDGFQPAGTYAYAWDGVDASGRQLPGGVYFGRIRAGADLKTIKLTLVR